VKMIEFIIRKEWNMFKTDKNFEYLYGLMKILKLLLILLIIYGFFLFPTLYGNQIPGTIRWNLQLTKDQRYSEIAIAPNGIICLMDNKKLIILESDGSLFWSLNLQVLINQTFGPMIDPNYSGDLGVKIFNLLPIVINRNGILFLEFRINEPRLNNNYIIAIGDSGKINWHVNLGRSFDSGYTSKPIIDNNGTIYIASESGGGEASFYQINKDGIIMNSAKINHNGERIYSDLAMHENLGILFGSRRFSPDPQGCLILLNKNFEPLWTYSKLGYFAIDSQLNIYLRSSRFTFGGNPAYELKLEKLDNIGNQKWYYPGASGPPVIYQNHQIYISNEDTVYSFLENGDLLWKKAMLSKICSPLIVGDVGILYFGCKDSSFNALDLQGNILWSIKLDGYIERSPTLDNDGNLYVLTKNNILYAINSESNGLDPYSWSKIYHDAQNTGYLPTQVLVEETTKQNKKIFSQNHPNPFISNTEINYQLISEQEVIQVVLNIYNLKGQLVKQLVNRSKAPGSYTINWDGTDLKGKPVASSVYFYSIITDEYRETNKMLMIKQ
jgi:outer membrane protein assembly factor BamB